MCPAANIYWFLVFKGCNQEDVYKMLEHCFSPDELVEVRNTEYDKFKQTAVLKEKIEFDMSLVIQDNK